MPAIAVVDAARVGDEVSEGIDVGGESRDVEEGRYSEDMS